MVDPDGYRPNVGIVLMRPDGQVFWARRVRRDGWQFPQGGMNTDETPLEAMYRELREETGLLPEHVEVLGATPGWLRYRLPPRAVRRNERHVCIGQKQVWFLLNLLVDETHVRLDLTESPEFDHWRWVDFWYPMEHVVMFKRSVYARALDHLAPLPAAWRGSRQSRRRRCRGCRCRPARRVRAREAVQRINGVAASRPTRIDNHSHSMLNMEGPSGPIRELPCTSASAMESPIARSSRLPPMAAGACRN